MHGGRGVDGQVSVQRIAEVIGELDCDIVCLQEVGSLRYRRAGEVQFEFLASLPGYNLAAGPTGPGQYGNALLSRYQILESYTISLKYRNREPRGLLLSTLAVPDQGSGDEPHSSNQAKWLVGSTHLGLKRKERKSQISTIIPAMEQAAAAQNAQHLILCGDMNEWFPLSPLDRKLRNGADLHARLRRSFPSRFPLLCLDRIYCNQQKAGRWYTHTTSLARLASDHLPLVLETSESTESATPDTSR
ncbi:MAG: endonuclease/exonuclease/phosphatase family protein [Leptospiraceae bacterium]|nr:endonuclease/exonuclease/phosphatase family protein [Leptospiraceae bacterium]